MKLEDLYYKSPYLIRYPIFIIEGAFQAKYRYGNEFHRILEDLLNNLTLSRDEVKKMQIIMMQNLLLHAYNHVPFYKRTFKNIGFHPQDYHDENDLKNLPILTKDIIRDNFNDMIADNLHNDKIVPHQSGGTTGAPLKFYLSKRLRGPFNFATLYRFYHWAGVSFGERRVTVGGRLITKRPPFTMVNPSENQLYVCAHFLNAETLETISRSIINFRPRFIQGHPSALAVLSQYLTNKGIIIPVKAIFTTSENLYDEQRCMIENVFACKVFDTYGMGEMVASASECCEHKGYHLAPEYGITEVINHEIYGGEIGELISTSLQNYVMPLIRYKCGDIGKIRTESCPCGCNFPMLEKISGRIDDVIITSNGKYVLPLMIRISMKKAGFSEFQLIQETETKFKLHLFLNPSLAERPFIVKQVHSILSDIFQDNSSFEVNFNCQPIRTTRGKQQMVIKKGHSSLNYS